MQEYAQKPEKSSSDSNFRSSGQPPISEILQAYKNGTLQRMSVDEEELLQAKTRDKSSERETLQRYTDYTHRDKSRYNSLIQGMFDTPQRKGIEDEELLQGKFESSSVASESPMQRVEKPNNTGLPDNLKSGIENLSGYSLDDVKVHYNSDKPAQLSALAYAQGTDIHVAPGQERYLPHEAWHVVQQKQGRVQPTMQMQGVDVNDNEGLEREADVVGESVMKQSGPIIEKQSPKTATRSYMIQRWPDDGSPTDHFSDSVFQNTKKEKTSIYMLFDSATEQEEVNYIGKTVQQGDNRFQQHRKSKNLTDDVKSEVLIEREWTPFETATHEQYWIGEAGGLEVLDNRINALSIAKWNWFKRPDHAINHNQETDLKEGHF